MKLAARPTLADIQCTRIQFEPGDHILVKTNNLQPFDESTIKRLKKIILKWAGVEIEILVVQRCLMDVEIVKAKKELIV